MSDKQRTNNYPLDLGLKRGLVLEGGGAKGAFQFGVLLALRDAGVEFDAVSGTSVGALNGFLWATGNLDIGRRLWSGLERQKVFAWRLTAFLFPIAAILWLFAEQLHGRSIPDVPPRVSRVLSFIQQLPFLFIGLLGATIMGVGFGRRYQFVGWTIGIAFAVMTLRGAFTPGTKDSFRHGMMAALFGNGVAVYILAHSSPREWTWKSIVEWGAVFWAFSAPYWLLALAWVFARLNVSLFDPRPLADLIDDAASDRVLMPTFATVTERVEYFDPDRLTYEAVNTPRGVTAYYEPMPHSAYYPRYVSVDRLNRQERREVLLASAALPPAVTPSRHIGSQGGIIDGGVADNLPWKPLVLDVPCDELVIVGCNPIETWNIHECQEDCREHERLRRVLATAHRPPTIDRGANPIPVQNVPPSVIPLHGPAHWPRSVVTIAPTKPLGTFLSATINFDGTRARRLVQEGYKVGCAAIQVHGLAISKS